MSKEFALPDLGEGITEAQVIRVMIQEGDDVAEDQYLMEVETDKAAVEIPSPFAGKASRVHVKEGDTVNVGDVVVTIDDNGAAAPPAKAEKKPAKKEEQQAEKPSERKRESAKDDGKSAAAQRPSAQESPPSSARRTTVPAAPAVRKLARERGIDIEEVEGTGPGGRVTREDVENFQSGGGRADRDGGEETSPPRKIQRLGGLPDGTDDEDKWGPIRKVRLSQIRKTIANQMTRSAFTAVHVTHGDEADITELDRMRRALNEATGNDPKLTAMTFVIRAVCLAMRNHPIFNAAFDEENGEIIYKKYINMGIAVDSDRGLIVPVVRDVGSMSMRDIARELRTIADLIRSNKFAIEDLRGGTFTITNVGALGGSFSTPIINYPEVAILGLGRSRKVPAFKNGNVVEATVLPLNLSFDHRATDGANAARFTTEIKEYLETPARFLLD